MNGLLDDEDPIVVFSFLQTGCEIIKLKKYYIHANPTHVRFPRDRDCRKT